MRSDTYLSLAFLLLLAAGSCTGQDDVVAQVCDSIRSCTGEPLRDSCAHALNQGVDHYQISLAGLSRCADCLSNLRGDCTAMLTGRVCDKACDEIPVALNASTTRDERTKGCRLLSGCSAETQQANCVSLLKEGDKEALLGGLDNDSTLSMDPTLGKCLRCLFAVPLPARGGAGAGGVADVGGTGSAETGGVGGANDACGAESAAPGSLACQALVNGCMSACAAQPQLNGILSRAAAAPQCTNGEAP